MQTKLEHLYSPQSFYFIYVGGLPSQNSCVFICVPMFICLYTLAGIREHVAAQRFNSCVTIIKRHIIEEYTEGSLQESNHDLAEPVKNAPFLSTSDDIEEFFDATMDQISETFEVRLRIPVTLELIGLIMCLVSFYVPFFMNVLVRDNVL